MLWPLNLKLISILCPFLQNSRIKNFYNSFVKYTLHPVCQLSDRVYALLSAPECIKFGHVCVNVSIVKN